MNFSLENTGRPFTDYKSNSTSNQFIKHKHNIQTNNEYRHFLTSNASSIITNNKNNAYGLTPFDDEKHEYTPCPQKSNYIFTTDFDMDFPYEYESSNLKQLHLSKRQLNQRKHTPLVNQDKLLSYNK
jgi:hypothetical protein